MCLWVSRGSFSAVAVLSYIPTSAKMSGRIDRFTKNSVLGLVGQQPQELLKLFNAKSMKEVMNHATTVETDLQKLVAEAERYMDPQDISDILEFAEKQRSLPVECAFALRAYSQSDVCAVLNPIVQQGHDLQTYHQLCICMIKGLALLPPYAGKVFRGIEEVQIQDVCERIVYSTSLKYSI